MMNGEQPVCAKCGYPLKTGQHGPHPEESEEREMLLGCEAAAIEALGVRIDAKELTPENFREKFEQAMLQAVHGLPEQLAERLNTVNAEVLAVRAAELITELETEKDPEKRAELQVELIYQYIVLISRVQGAGDKAYTPALANEVGELDCSLSAWSLKEKLQASHVDDIQFEFGYPADHAVGVVTIADGRKLYVDAQNGFAAEVALEEVSDESNPNTAYPIYQIRSSKRLSGHIPDEGEISRGRSDGSDFIPKNLGIKKDGILHTIGNMHMLMNPESPIYDSQTAQNFRDSFKNDPSRWERFQNMVSEIAGGAVIQETKFYKEEV